MCVYKGGYGLCVCVLEDNYTTVEYALAVPHRDVRLEIGWIADLDQANRLYLTVAGQLLAFSLNAT